VPQSVYEQFFPFVRDVAQRNKLLKGRTVAVDPTSLEATALAMLATTATIAACLAMIDEEGPDALVQLPGPVNQFPDLASEKRRYSSVLRLLAKQVELLFQRGAPAR